MMKNTMFYKIKTLLTQKKERLHILFIHIFVSIPMLVWIPKTQELDGTLGTGSLGWILPWHQSNNINKESRHNCLVFTSHRLYQYQHVLLV